MQVGKVGRMMWRSELDTSGLAAWRLSTSRLPAQEPAPKLEGSFTNSLFAILPYLTAFRFPLSAPLRPSLSVVVVPSPLNEFLVKQYLSPDILVLRSQSSSWLIITLSPPSLSANRLHNVSHTAGSVHRRR